MSREQQRECMLENLASAAPLAAEVGVLLTIEMLNPIDNPGYFLTSSHEAIEIVKQINHPHIRYQLDTYHVQMTGGNLVQIITQNSDWIGHIQIADYPGRHEPGTGQIDFVQLTATIEAAGYHDYIGLEYKPQAAGAGALQWAIP